MEARAQAITVNNDREAPLFASPWMALFLLLRRGWLAPRFDD